MSSAAQPAHEPPDPQVHPLVRNALRVSLSAKEYKLLHEHVLKRTPNSVQSRVPTPSRYEAIVHSKDKYGDAAIRASLRVFLLTAAGSKLAELAVQRIGGDSVSKYAIVVRFIIACVADDGANARRDNRSKTRTALIRSPTFRLALSLSLVLFIHRILHRFFVRLRANLRTDDARPFRERNPRISQALTSRYAPAVGASVAGFALGICPLSRLRITVAIYTATRSLEFLYNVLDEQGWLEQKPWWFGSWLLMPVSCAQLFHAFVFDRETVPKWFGNVIFRLSPSYIQSRPAGFPEKLHWPDKYEIVDSLATIADLKWPAFISPILHPTRPDTLPRPVKSISPVTSPAHPSISSLSCALLHPNTPSCSTAFLHHLLLSIPPLARVLAIATLALTALKYKKFLASPVSATNAASKRVLALTAVLSTSVGSAWGSLCLLNSLLSRSTLPTKRFFISGAIAGLPFAFLRQGRGTFLYIFRTAVYSAWTTGVKRGLWRGWKGGELWVFVLSWALMGSILEGKPGAVEGAGIRKGLAWLRGEGFVDPVEVAARRKKKAQAGQKKAQAGLEAKP